MSEAKLREATEKSHPCTEQQHAHFRSTYGSLAYLQCTRPDILCVLATLGQYMHAPHNYSLTLLRQFAAYVKHTSTTGLFFPAANVKDDKLWLKTARLRGHKAQT